MAEFIADGLTARGLDASFLDEDWGWQTHAARPDGTVLEVSIYHDPDEVGEDEWALMVRSLRKERNRARDRAPAHDAYVARRGCARLGECPSRLSPRRASRSG